MSHLLVGAVHLLLSTQATEGSVRGTIRDADTRTPIIGAVVLLPDLDRSAVSDSGGRYVVGRVPAGPTHVVVRRIGYAPQALHALVPSAGSLEINVALQRTAVALPRVDVRAPIPLRGVDSGINPAPGDRGMTMAAVMNHPMIAEPDVLQALGGGEVLLKPETPAGVSIRGGASDQTGYTLDGVPVLNPYHAGGMFSAWNHDALARIDIVSQTPAPEHPYSLSGTVNATTRPPGAEHRAAGGVSTSQARLTLHGPLGANGTGYLLGFRSGFAGLLGRAREAVYVGGESGDAIAKLETVALGGRLRILGYGNENELSSAAAVEGDETAPALRNRFEWRSRSLGAEWRRKYGSVTLRALAWTASADAHSEWGTAADRQQLRSLRRDDGLLVSGGRGSGRVHTTAGVRLERTGATYSITGLQPEPALELAARTPVLTLLTEHARLVGGHAELTLAARAAAVRGRIYGAPAARIAWRVSDRLDFSASAARALQLAQSLRNPESLVGAVFPADLSVAVGAPGVPVARSDQAVLAARYGPRPGIRLGAQLHMRSLKGLVLVAPRAADPFATGGFVTGRGGSRGFSLEAAASRARYGMLASYGMQRVRLRYADSTYVPGHGTAHTAAAGIVVFPGPTSSLRLAVTTEHGRRGSLASGVLEWESCNVKDRGCEFAGTPRYDVEGPGRRRLPPYVRVDFGARKHWHVELFRRDATIALFAALTNVLGRTNVLGYALEPDGTEPVPVEMASRAPVVLGLDWRF